MGHHIENETIRCSHMSHSERISMTCHLNSNKGLSNIEQIEVIKKRNIKHKNRKTRQPLILSIVNIVKQLKRNWFSRVSQMIRKEDCMVEYSIKWSNVVTKHYDIVLGVCKDVGQ